jgi:hypothetical protein
MIMSESMILTGGHAINVPSNTKLLPCKTQPHRFLGHEFCDGLPSGTVRSEKPVTS